MIAICWIVYILNRRHMSIERIIKSNTYAYGERERERRNTPSQAKRLHSNGLNNNIPALCVVNKCRVCVFMPNKRKRKTNGWTGGRADECKKGIKAATLTPNLSISFIFSLDADWENIEFLQLFCFLLIFVFLIIEKKLDRAQCNVKMNVLTHKKGKPHHERSRSKSLCHATQQ